EIDGVKIITHIPAGADRERLRDFVDSIRRACPSAAILLGTVENGKVVMTAAVTRDLIQRGIKAGDCIKAAVKVVGGGGGGRADMAEAGGRFPEKLPEALETGAAYYREKLSAK
ncbi:MAG: alanine--tRNA ligase, partial [Planctomycetes bacterium]|nr:alanine--tRNA ligase [Planctomycetota bacterium]